MLIQGTPLADELFGTNDDDTILADTGADRVEARGGNDEIRLTFAHDFEWSDWVDGGTGIDRLVVDATAGFGDVFWYALASGGALRDGAGYRSTMAEIETMLGVADLLMFTTWNDNSGVRFQNIEHLDLLASTREIRNNLMIVIGDGRYDGGPGQKDALYADWSDAIDPIEWLNFGDATIQQVNGSQISEIERLVLRTGSGDDRISNGGFASNDEIVTGDGNDYVHGGAGADRIDTGAGDDEIRLTFANSFEFGDWVHGGTGNDLLIVDAGIGASDVFWYSVTDTGALLDGAGYRSTMAEIETMLARSPVWMFTTSNDSSGVRFRDIEHLSLEASGLAATNDLLIVIGNGRYDGARGTSDALYADWSDAVAPIVWDNLANATVQTVNGSQISNVERLVLRTGTGDDEIRNTVFATNDEIASGDGNDVIDAGAGADRVDAGAGDDEIRLTFANAFEFSDWVYGGSGSDRLIVDATAGAGDVFWYAVTDTGTPLDGAGYNSTMTEVERMLAASPMRMFTTWNDSSGVRFRDIEHLSLSASTADARNDLLIAIGDGHHDGAGGTRDTLYADWSAATAPIVWDNLATATVQTVNGSQISNVERLLLRTGDGDDVLRNTIAASNDDLRTGAGNDTIRAGAGNDFIDGGAGIDASVYAGPITEYSVHLNRAARSVEIVDDLPQRDGQDTLVGIERLEFDGRMFELFNAPRVGAPAYGQSRTFLFDASYYLLSNPDLVPTLAMADAAQHYLDVGAARGYAPNTWFDPLYYADRWDDLWALDLDEATLFLHYNLYGVWEGRSAGPIFDAYDGNRYLTDNPDVAAYVDAYVGDFLGSRTNGAIAHFVIYGAEEGRKAYDTAGNEIEMGIFL